ncbi:MAG: PLP-dependent aminotransferase family protein [Alphaproteobacteria bacterium]|nr:PLP-dependent aminotransferase family protein [Alphaproteobacteria bacterium]MBU0797694.1 PLP-dependent aminotransferase family protein [Alphaproteobacteria bacterium]MBU0888379.1 PLP-dependent aminotransferase family protein [Alphaproteobacteria bacterium]MBU1814690.1 PLP-dependent aminotransferase family protein [Alphaproteobacteria bacterium]MBU2088936.1 PLP-dependent aminotransferase family protein [Alphaproteobacteria bacterium]
MLERFFAAPLDPAQRLQQQIQERLIEAILAGALPFHEPLPATRIMAQRIQVSRNTVTLVYERLAEDGYLKSVNRRGYFIDERFVREQLNIKVDDRAKTLFPSAQEPVDFTRLLHRGFARQQNIVKPGNWRDFPYPFIYGQTAPDKTSLSRWRDCVRIAGTMLHSRDWMPDNIDADDPLLVEQIIRRILPQRGFSAGAENLLITVGAQNALYLVATLLARPNARVDMEDPGYVDARNIFGTHGIEVRPHPVDGDGMRVTPALAGSDLVYVTPGHQSPTNVTMSMERRLSLLSAAEAHDFFILEDDYEHELNFVGPQRAALKSFDQTGRVVHVGSLSKPLFPGLRLGFIAAAPPLIAELRALRRLMYRHTSSLDQRAMAIFLSEGHFDAHIRRQRASLAEKWKTLLGAAARLLPECDVTMTTGGSAIWLTLPKGMKAREVETRAAKIGLLVESGDVHYLRPDPPQNRLRLGYAAIPLERIEPGLKLLAGIVRDLSA